MAEETKKHDESEMRDAKVPWLKTPEELAAYVQGLVEGKHDYGTCAYAMSMAAVAAYNYAANALGVTGFQASCADMDILRRNRHMEGPFMIVDCAKALYPQYDLVGDLIEYLAKDDTKRWLKEQAQKKLAENPDSHRAVVSHWMALAAVELEPTESVQ